MLFYILKIGSKILSILPRTICLYAGIILGYAMYWLFPLRKKVALTNLRIAFPQKSSSELKNILKKCYIHFGILSFDFMRLSKLNKNNINQLIKLDETTKNILDENNPSIIMTGHLGNWEMLLPLLGYNNYKSAGVAQIQKNKSGEKFFNWIRSCDNTKLIPKKSSINKMSQALDENYFLILASDQNAGKNGTLNSFFNEPTSTPKGGAIFHIKKNIPIIILFIIMNKDYTYSIKSKKLEVNFDNIKNDEKINIINQNYNIALEKLVIKHPNQYFWFHRKWDKKHYK